MDWEINEGTRQETTGMRNKLERMEVKEFFFSSTLRNIELAEGYKNYCNLRSSIWCN